MEGRQVKDKQKLTLSISKDIIEKARAEGINISAITEQILTAITFSPDQNTRDDLIDAYENFFSALRPFLKKYGTSIRVGTVFHEPTGIDLPIRLSGDNLVLDDIDDSIHTISISSYLSDLDSPIVILENLIPALIQAAQKNKEKMKEFEISLRFLKALSVEDVGTKKK